MDIEVEGYKYKLIRNDNNCFDLNLFKEKVTDYFFNYDYICGDYAGNKLRLKGFMDSNNKDVNKINDIAGLDTYILQYCTYQANIFLLKKVK